MNTDRTARIGGVALLERALAYTLGSLNLITPPALTRPTPCAGWDLRLLLTHMHDSLLALIEAAAYGRVAVEVREGGGDPVTDLVRPLKDRACELLGLWADPDASTKAVAVRERQLPSPIVATTGALEVTMHGWDVARSCGHDRPIPAGLADQLLELAPLIITPADRPWRFNPPVSVSPLAGPSDRLVAFTGRDPAVWPR
jgi:uncharacterized protein (TIGR03086 family)